MSGDPKQCYDCEYRLQPQYMPVWDIQSETVETKKLRQLELAKNHMDQLDNFYDGSLDKEFSLEFLYEVLNKWSHSYDSNPK